MRVAGAVAAVTLAAAGCYDFTFDERAPEAADAGGALDAGDRAEPREAAAPADAATADARASECKAGGYYCGGEHVAGASDTLYRCNADGTATLMARCANGCAVMPPGTDDACRPPTPCVSGGEYCGGDKVNGHPDVLYRCGADGSSISVVRRCAKGCVVRPGSDDVCKS